jgi:hypothetical protein
MHGSHDHAKSAKLKDGKPKKDKNNHEEIYLT